MTQCTASHLDSELTVATLKASFHVANSSVKNVLHIRCHCTRFPRRGRVPRRERHQERTREQVISVPLLNTSLAEIVRPQNLGSCCRCEGEKPSDCSHEQFFNVLCDDRLTTPFLPVRMKQFSNYISIGLGLTCYLANKGQLLPFCLRE